MQRLTTLLAATLATTLLLFALPPAASGADAGGLDGLEYVSLGDSYQAGYGLVPFSTTSPFAGDPNGCYQADANYPHGVAAALGLTLDDETCSGAITANIGYGSATVPASVTNVILPTLPTVTTPQTTSSGMTAPTVQSAGLSADTDIVTVGIGGNDLGFSYIATSCIRLSLDSDPIYLYEKVGAFDNCSDYFGDPVGYPSAYLPGRLADAVQPRLEATFAEIRAAAPNAQVFVVGYPQVAPADATSSCFSSPLTPNSVPFSPEDLDFLHGVEDQLDTFIEDAATAAGFHFISTWDQTAQNTLCSPEPWIAGITIDSASGSTCPPDFVPVDSGSSICIKLGALHPNPTGVAGIETIVQTAIADTMALTSSAASVFPGGQLMIQGGGFAPNEDVEIWLHSTPVLLSTIPANALGAISTTITIPTTATPGAHSIVATGVTSGRSFSTSLTINSASPAVVPIETLGNVGADPRGLVVLGGALLALGVALLVARRLTPAHTQAHSSTRPPHNGE